jgi:hypothetical protein
MRQMDVPARPLKFLPQGGQRRLSIGPSHGRAGTAGRHRTPGKGDGALNGGQHYLRARELGDQQGASKLLLTRGLARTQFASLKRASQLPT